jgi:cell wall-associated NlpC family hydrolase
MKRYTSIAISALFVLIQSAAPVASAQEIEIKYNHQVLNNSSKDILVYIQEQVIKETLLEQQARHKKELLAKQEAEIKVQNDNYRAVENRINELKKYVNKTYYVFSGATPEGWDCSGMTMWFYQGLGVEIPHRAHEQLFVGTKVSNPQIGDLVLMDYWKNGKIDHAAIYIGNGAMIHSGFGKGDKTEIVENFAEVENAKITYIRVLNMPSTRRD